MRILGVDISGSECRWILISGTKHSFTIHQLPKQKLPFPQTQPTDIANLIEVQKIVEGLIDQYSVDQLAIIASGQQSKPFRSKVEVILELAGFAKKKPVNLYASSAVTKLEKTGFPKLTKKTITDFVDGGIQPAYLTKPFYVAWKHLSDR